MESQKGSVMEYLTQENIGGVLAQALGVLYQTKPEYPVSFLEQYLRLYNYNQKMASYISKNQSKLKEIENKVVEIEYSKWTKEQQKKKKFLMLGGYPEKIMKDFNDLRDYQEYFKSTLCNSLVQNKLADHVYVGRYQHQTRKVRKIDQIYL
jgi:uncharacterized protein (DUF2164 family)